MPFSKKSLNSNVNVLILVRYSVPWRRTDVEARYSIPYHRVERAKFLGLHDRRPGLCPGLSWARSTTQELGSYDLEFIVNIL